MIEFIIGVGAGVYLYKRVQVVRTFIDFDVSKYHNNIKDYIFHARHKVVRFDKDTYAIRRWDMGYEYLDLRDYKQRNKELWWRSVDCVQKYATDTLQECERNFKILKQRKLSSKTIKYGKPI